MEARHRPQCSVEIKLEVDNRPGVLAEVAARIADNGSNIEVSIDERHDDAADMLFSILVHDRRHCPRHPRHPPDGRSQEDQPHLHLIPI